MNSQNVSILFFLSIILSIVVFICYCLYTPSSKTKYIYPAEDIVQRYETNPRRADLEDLQNETRLMGFGMGPGLVDSRRHHVTV